CSSFLRVELPGGIGRDKAWWSNQEIAIRLAPTAVELLGNSTAINRQGIRLPYEGVGLEGMRFLQATALALYLGPGISKVDLAVLDPRTRREHPLAFPTAFQPAQPLVLDLHIPGKVEFTGLQDSPCCRRGIAAPLQLYRVKKRPVGHVVLRINLIQRHITR